MEAFLEKGMRIRAVWFEDDGGVLSGSQVKISAKEVVVEGVVTHIRGDHPTRPTSVRVWVLQDDGEEKIVNPTFIREIL